MSELITVGETLAVMVPRENGSLCYNTDYRIRVAGAESNVAVGLRKLGHDTTWVSRLGDDGLGQRVLHAIRAEGVDVSQVIIDQNAPTGLMFKEFGSRETKVFYYRGGSAASHMNADDIEREVLSRSEILHMTGVTPVISESCREMTEQLFCQAEETGVKISFDPNVRRKLWKGKDYSGMLREFALRSQIVLLGVEEAEILFGKTNPEDIAEELFTKGKAQYVAVKNGSYGAWVSDGKRTCHVEPFACRPVDSVGAGDGFNAGFLAGILEKKTIDICGRMGAIVGAMATETDGDYEGYPLRGQLERILREEEEIYR